MMKPRKPFPNTASANGSIEPRIGKPGTLTVVGLSRQQNLAKRMAIPGQWQQFMTRYEEIDNKAEPIPVSVTTEWMATEFLIPDGFIVSSAGKPAKGLVARSVLRRPTQSSRIPERLRDSQTYAAIWDQWVPQSGKVASDGPFLEKHLPTFNPRPALAASRYGYR